MSKENMEKQVNYLNIIGYKKIIGILQDSKCILVKHCQFVKNKLIIYIRKCTIKWSFEGYFA